MSAISGLILMTSWATRVASECKPSSQQQSSNVSLIPSSSSLAAALLSTSSTGQPSSKSFARSRATTHMLYACLNFLFLKNESAFILKSSSLSRQSGTTWFSSRGSLYLFCCRCIVLLGVLQSTNRGPVFMTLSARLAL